MNVGLIAHNEKKNLIEDFCVAYKKILEKHQLYATGTTGRRIEEVTSLKVHKFLPGSLGGDKQFMETICRNGLDMVLFFYNPAMVGKRSRVLMKYQNAVISIIYRLPRILPQQNH